MMMKKERKRERSEQGGPETSGCSQGGQRAAAAHTRAAQRGEPWQGGQGGSRGVAVHARASRRVAAQRKRTHTHEKKKKKKKKKTKKKIKKQKADEKEMRRKRSFCRHCQHHALEFCLASSPVDRSQEEGGTRPGGGTRLRLHSSGCLRRLILALAVILFHVQAFAC